MSLADAIRPFLRPAGGGIHTVSTGVAAQANLQRALYGVSEDREIGPAWEAALGRVEGAKVAVLGIPSDVGAGFHRGAAFGPQAIRAHALDRPASIYRDPRVVDLGDVRVVPQLLHDEMLGDDQRRASEDALYGDEPRRRGWPVSPLSIAERVLVELRRAAPGVVPVVLGGDHSVAWPVVQAVAAGRERALGILHFDAHTDLLETRLGVRYCFATWAFHANALIGGERRLAQVGLRISSRSRAHWESTLGVRQYWADEVRARPLEAIAAEIVGDFSRAGVRGVYVSNDIDGTDPAFAAATGTPEPDGLRPEVVEELVRAVGAAFPIWAADVVEVAPGLALDRPGEPARTLETAARYFELAIEVGLG